jgi:dipeptidyl-peptidase III
VTSRLPAFLLLLCAGATAAAEPPATPAAPAALVARVDNTGFVKVEANSFTNLSPQQQALAYWLGQAAIAIDPIIYDQLSAYGLREKRLLEQIVAHSAALDTHARDAITQYTEIFWANRGNHNLDTAQKFVPAFTFEELQAAALRAQRVGAFTTPCADLPPIRSPAALEKELQALRAALFDASFEPMMTAKQGGAATDIVQASSNTFYEGVSLAQLNGFHDRYALNSRVVRNAQGGLVEQVYRAGSADGKAPPGLYAVFLRRAIGYLRKAQGLADTGQAQVIADLIRYYETGEADDWLRFDADWVRNISQVDFSNGFVEVYRDARGAKGSAAAFVSITDETMTDAVNKLAVNAAYFEERAPWDPKYRKTQFARPSIMMVETTVESGDFEVTTLGDNLPNENSVREKYGSKNFLFVSGSRAVNPPGASHPLLEAFEGSPQTIARDERYGQQAGDLMASLHEVIGHGSGKLSERFAHGSRAALKEYYSTLEEARADLMALWNIWDPKLKELGLVVDQGEVAKAMYDHAAETSLTQLRYVPKGDTIEEDHLRDRQLIARYIMDTTGAIEQYRQDGKTYLRVTDYARMRQGVGALLAELMRIKAEGDYEAIKALVDRYGSHFDPALRDEVIARYAALDLPTYFAGIYARLTARFDGRGRITAVALDYPSDPPSQYLAFGALYDRGLSGSRLVR